MEDNALLTGLSLLLLLGMGAQWLSWRFGLPTIVVLLSTGFIAGPIFGWIDADKLFGHSFNPLVSMAVAIILFEGGLSLQLSDIKGVGKTVLRLISTGTIVTWAILSLAASLLIGLDYMVAALMGAILTVTGPTVVLPILRQVRLKGTLPSIFKWEGILIDPIGALLAVLVFEAIRSQNFTLATAVILKGLLLTLAVGASVGWVGAQVIKRVIQNHWIADYLENPFTLTMVVLAFVGANQLQPEAGLLSVTLMGIFLANQREIAVKHIVAFKETLGVILISGLFLLMASRLEIESFVQLGESGLWYLLVVLFIARPISVFLSAIGSRLNWREKIYLSLMAPRGVVAAAITSIFAFELEAINHPQAGLMVPLAFTVIMGTVLFSGIIAYPLSRLLKLQQKERRGLFIVGAHTWARQLGKLLQELDLPVLMFDRNSGNVLLSRLMGLPAVQGNILSDSIAEEVDLSAMGRLLALTPNDEVNTLSTLHFSDEFGKNSVYQLVPNTQPGFGSTVDKTTSALRGGSLFNSSLTFNGLTSLIEQGYELHRVPVSKEMTIQKTLRTYHPDAQLLMAVERETKMIHIETVHKSISELSIDGAVITVTPPEGVSQGINDEELSSLSPS